VSNVNNPHGLRPLMRTMSGGEIQLFPFLKLVGYGTALFVFDVVNRVTGGAIQGGGTPGTTVWSGVTLNGGAASTATTHQVLVSEDAVYEAQDGNFLAGIVAANLGQNANLNLTVAGSTTRPNLSGHQIDDNTVATTSSLDLHLLNLLNVPNNALGPYARVEVRFNKQRMAGAGVAGV
jgi:hypothetical protein